MARGATQSNGKMVVCKASYLLILGLMSSAGYAQSVSPWMAIINCALAPHRIEAGGEFAISFFDRKAHQCAVLLEGMRAGNRVSGGSLGFSYRHLFAGLPVQDLGAHSLFELSTMGSKRVTLGVRVGFKGAQQQINLGLPVGKSEEPKTLSLANWWRLPLSGYRCDVEQYVVMPCTEGAGSRIAARFGIGIHPYWTRWFQAGIQFEQNGSDAQIGIKLTLHRFQHEPESSWRLGYRGDQLARLFVLKVEATDTAGASSQSASNRSTLEDDGGINSDSENLSKAQAIEPSKATQEDPHLNLKDAFHAGPSSVPLDTKKLASDLKPPAEAALLITPSSQPCVQEKQEPVHHAPSVIDSKPTLLPLEKSLASVPFQSEPSLNACDALQHHSSVASEFSERAELEGLSIESTQVGERGENSAFPTPRREESERFPEPLHRTFFGRPYAPPVHLTPPVGEPRNGEERNDPTMPFEASQILKARYEFDLYQLERQISEEQEEMRKELLSEED